MKNLYGQLVESIKVQWPDSQFVSHTEQPENRPFHVFVIERAPKREITVSLADYGLLVSCFIEGTANEKNYKSGTLDRWYTLVIENEIDQKFIHHTIDGKTHETNCYDCLQSIAIDQMKQALLLSDTE